MKLQVIATGGTISSHFDGTEWTNLDGHALLAELGDTPTAGVRQVDLDIVDVASGPSSSLTVDDMVAVARRARQALADGADGVVVVHGTDTMELTAFVAQLLLGTSPAGRPVVFTGSMRVHSHPLPDGPQNLRDALAVAAHPGAHGRDVLVCAGGQLHAATTIRKRHAASVDAFTSDPFPPLGTVHEGAVAFTGPSPERLAATALAERVPLITCYPGIDATDVDACLSDCRGAVIEGFGDLNVPQQLWGPIHAAWQRGALVVLASRPFTPTVTNDGLAHLGAVGAGGLTAQKARLAVMAALATCDGREAAAAFLRQYALSYDPGTRGTSA